jgi:hypothetical protein
MTKTAFLVALIVTALASMPAEAQRVFVSGQGLDTNPCTVTQPCRTFQHAHDIAPANSEIDVLDPAGYGPLTITHGISIQAHGFGGITQTAGCPISAAIQINVTTGDPVTLNGLLLDGGGTGCGKATLNRITVNNNGTGVYAAGVPTTTIANSVISNNITGLHNTTGIAVLAKTVITGNEIGVNVATGVASFGDNYITDSVMGALTPVTTQ